MRGAGARSEPCWSLEPGAWGLGPGAGHRPIFPNGSPLPPRGEKASAPSIAGLRRMQGTAFPTACAQPTVILGLAGPRQAPRSTPGYCHSRTTGNDYGVQQASCFLSQPAVDRSPSPPAVNRRGTDSFLVPDLTFVRNCNLGEAKKPQGEGGFLMRPEKRVLFSNRASGWALDGQGLAHILFELQCIPSTVHYFQGC